MIPQKIGKYNMEHEVAAKIILIFVYGELYYFIIIYQKEKWAFLILPLVIKKGTSTVYCNSFKNYSLKVFCSHF